MISGRCGDVLFWCGCDAGQPEPAVAKGALPRWRREDEKNPRGGSLCVVLGVFDV